MPEKRLPDQNLSQLNQTLAKVLNFLKINENPNFCLTDEKSLFDRSLSQSEKSGKSPKL